MTADEKFTAFMELEAAIRGLRPRLFVADYTTIKGVETTDETTRSHGSSNRSHRQHARGVRRGVSRCLLSEKLTDEQRRAIGWTLIAIGALTTIPLALQLFSDDE